MHLTQICLESDYRLVQISSGKSKKSIEKAVLHVRLDAEAPITKVKAIFDLMGTILG